MLRTGLKVIKLRNITKYEKLTPQIVKFSKLAKGTSHLILFTVLSGAFVAGLDAGLIYNEFPLMGGQLIPSDLYGLSKVNESIAFWRNFFEDATTTQFNHRIIATTTFSTVCYLFWRSKTLPLSIRRASALMLITAGSQFCLGIATLLYQVPIKLGVLHQGGAICLYSTSLWLLHVLKRFK
jgi:cytochrome c oxidase assembly protein subunit 15